MTQSPEFIAAMSEIAGKIMDDGISVWRFDRAPDAFKIERVGGEAWLALAPLNYGDIPWLNSTGFDSAQEPAAWIILDNGSTQKVKPLNGCVPPPSEPSEVLKVFAGRVIFVGYQ